MTPWSAQEDATLLALHGRPLKEIARALPCRSWIAVGTRLRAGGLFTRMRRQGAEPPRITVSIEEVARVYELGWRVADLRDGLVEMVWRGKGRPR